jgi:hypothetical protein
LLSTSALAILIHGSFLLFLQPDLSIGRGLPLLQFQQLFGHCLSLSSVECRDDQE